LPAVVVIVRNHGRRRRSSDRGWDVVGGAGAGAEVSPGRPVRRGFLFLFSLSFPLSLGAVSFTCFSHVREVAGGPPRLVRREDHDRLPGVTVFISLGIFGCNRRWSLFRIKPLTPFWKKAMKFVRGRRRRPWGCGVIAGVSGQPETMFWSSPGTDSGSWFSPPRLVIG